MALIILICTFALVECSPVANHTTLKEIAPPYVAQPQGRGTVGIITSAVLTLILCVWTAIHPNIISPDPTGFRALKVRIIYVLLALFAPEFVLAIAHEEWEKATDLCRWAQKIAARPGNSNQPNQRPSETVNSDSETGHLGGRDEGLPLLDTEHPSAEEVQVGPNFNQGGVEREPFAKRVKRDLGLLLQRLVSRSPMRATASEEAFFPIECGFFTVMGGFAFSPLGAPETDIHYQRILSLDGLKFLLEHDLITRDKFAKLKNDIKDKGKADTLAKLLACAQALWMFTNCLCRIIVGLPLTFIEVNVMIHVVCALCMYLLWLKKPNNVHHPISLTYKFDDPLISAMLFAPFISPDNCELTWEATANVQTNDPGPAAPLSYEDRAVGCIMENKSSLLVVGQYNGSTSMPGLERWIKSSKKQNGVVMLLPGQSLVDSVNGFTLRQFFSPRHFTQIELTILSNAARGFGDHRYTNIRGFDKQWFLDQPMNTWDIFQFRYNFHFTAVPLCLAYGGIHAIVWNDHFPTPVERQLWRASCIIVASTAVCMSLKLICQWLESSFSRLYHENMSTSFLMTFFLGLVGVLIWVEIHPNSPAFRRTMEILFACAIFLNILYRLSDNQEARTKGGYGFQVPRYFAAGIMGLGWCGYVAARVYIIVEAFVSLRSVQRGAFETVAWTDLWPHL